MIAELKAVRGALATISPAATAHLVDAGAAKVPYFIAWSSAGDRPHDEPAAGPCGAFSAPLGVTCTAATPEAAMNMADAAIAALTPGRGTSVLPGVAGRFVQVTYRGAEAVQVDRTLTLTGTNTHPAYAVVLFDVHSQPL